MKIIRTTRYAKDLKRIGVSEAEADAIEMAIASSPTAGDVMVGLKGVRKLRFRIGNRGKSGGGRAIYFLMLPDDAAIMLTAYAKNERADLSPAQRKEIAELLKGLDHG